MTPQHHLPADIERTSISIITRELDELGLTPPPETAAVVKRVIHTTADFDYAKNLRFTPGAVEAAVKPLDIAILRLPHVSNFTDFIPLEQHPLLGVRYVQRTRQLGAPDLVVLPGTKNTMDDLRWLRESGLEAAVLRLSAAGTPVLGVCGGYQMLGEQLCDPAGEESCSPSI